ncbi:MAG TPA: MbcA/ParS/Xre antitoxin family protein [Microvirga sp.]|jgi:hypothetical protein|nr:MbcA/ParS/Xre antitoxin family protein [Microvirga sp.]
MVTLQQVRPGPTALPADRHGLALKGFFGMMNRWGVDNDTARILLGSPPERTFFEWKRGRAGRLPEDTLRRIGYIAGIWKAIEILYSDPAIADGWVKRPNRHFGDQTPLERMAAGDVTDLAAVRAYLDAARGSWS